MSPRCANHETPAMFFCYNPGCLSGRLCCHKCKNEYHQFHKCIQVADLEILSRSVSPDQNQSQKISKLIYSTINSAQQCANQIQNSFLYVNEFRSLSLQSFSLFVKSIQGQKLTRLISEGKQPNQIKKNSENIASLVRFFQNFQQISFKNIESLCQRFQSKTKEWKEKINKSNSQYYKEIIQCQIQNLLNSTQKELFNARNNGPRQNLTQIDQENNHTIKDSFSIPILTDLTDFQAKMKDILQQIFALRTITTSPPLSRESVVLNPIPSSNFDAHLHKEKIENEREEPIKINWKEKKDIYRKVRISAEGEEKLSEDKINMHLQTICKEEKFLQSLHTFIIEGGNEFNRNHLQILAKHFPNLTKFNYIWNFEEEGIKLQKQQSFFQKRHSFDKSEKDLDMTQSLLDLYGKFQNLQNLSIGNIKKFDEKRLEIKNKKIKHITLGEYLQSHQDQVLPNSLRLETLKINGLITLNMFNIKVIDGGFMQKIINHHRETLKNIWLSECIQLQYSFHTALKDSKIQNFTLDQIKRINHQFFIPKTLKSFIADNCQFFTKEPFSGLQQAVNLKNFSIFDSIFHESPKVGKIILRQLASIPNCPIEYLNMGQCKSVENDSLKDIEKMFKLKELCIDNTHICLLAFSKSCKILSNLKKLAIVGLEVNASEQQYKKISGNKSMNLWCHEEIVKNCQNLRVLSIKFEQGLSRLDLGLGKKLRHLSITVSKKDKGYKKKKLMEFKKEVESKLKSCNLTFSP